MKTTFRDPHGFERPQSRIVLHAKAGHTSEGTTRKRRFAIHRLESAPDRELIANFPFSSFVKSKPLPSECSLWSSIRDSLA